jgi:hypothetical protein
MGLLADANLNALKDDKFWRGVHASIDKAGRWLIYTVIAGGIGLAGALGTLSPDQMLGGLGAIGIAAGVLERNVFAIPKGEIKDDTTVRTPTS